MKRALLSFLLIVSSSLLLVGHANATEKKSLQQLIDDTPVGGILQLEAKMYAGNIGISKPISIIGKNGTVIKGDKTTNVIEIESDDVTLDTLAIEGSGMSRSSQEEFSGIRVMANGAILKNLQITDSFHGIYLNKTKNTTMLGITVVGQGTGNLGNQGNGISIIRSSDNRIENSQIKKTRDGIFVELSNNNKIHNNVLTDTRYGLHYMYSNRNEFIGNEFVKNVGGAAIMHSDHILLKDNKFSFNQGSRSFGLIVQTSRDIQILNNEFHLNQRGLYLEQSTNNKIEGNEFFHNQIGIELWTSSTANVFLENNFEKNKIQALTVGGESNNEWFKNGVGNYWHMPLVDLNRDGVGDGVMEYTSSLSGLVESNELVYLFLSSPAIAIYEKANELMSQQKVMAFDKYPLLSERDRLGYMWGGLVVVLVVVIMFFYRRRMLRQ